jgi:hypothetical protein
MVLACPIWFGVRVFRCKDALNATAVNIRVLSCCGFFVLLLLHLLLATVVLVSILLWAVCMLCIFSVPASMLMLSAKSMDWCRL